MSVHYTAVQWNPQKRTYDAVIAAGVVSFVGVFLAVGAVLHPAATAETLLIRSLGLCAFALLHVILSIGPLARLNPRFLPLLYNRRHLGVTMFILALGHGAFSIFQFHALGDVNPLVSVLTSNGRWGSVPHFPFQPLGFGALLILFLMAATSHDFWLRNLTAPVWKKLHMGVYLAYGLLVTHVLLGALQSETSWVGTGLLCGGVAMVVGLHVAAALRERAFDRERSAGADGYVEVCPAERIPENRAVIATIAGERVAIFRHDGRISAVSNVCQHQNGPLGEGRILDGCITCPWHGYQYLPDTGASPPPFTEKVPVFAAKVEKGIVFVHPRPRMDKTA